MDYRDAIVKEAHEAMRQSRRILHALEIKLGNELYGFDSWDEAEEEARRRTVLDALPWGVARNERGNPVVRLAEPAEEDPEDIDLS